MHEHAPEQKPSYAALKSEIARLEAEAEEIRKAETTAAVAHVHKTIADHGLTMQDLGFAPAATSGKTRKAKGAPTPAKYRDPVSGAGWSGRGRRPNWIAQAEAKGTTLESCRVM